MTLFGKRLFEGGDHHLAALSIEYNRSSSAVSVVLPGTLKTLRTPPPPVHDYGTLSYIARIKLRILS